MTARRSAAAVLAALACAGCGSAAKLPAQTPHRASGAGLTTAERRLDRLYTDISGTPAERDAGELVAYHIAQDPFTRCMRAHGIDYRPAPFAHPWRFWPAAGSGSFSTRWLASLGDRDHTSLVRQGEAAAQRSTGTGQRRSDRAYTALGPHARARWDRAVKRCPQHDASEAWHPAGYYPLLGAFHAMVDSVDYGLGRFAGAYGRCMTAAGFPARSHLALVAHIAQILPQSPDAVPAPGAQGNAAWRRAIAYEQAAGAADARCRRPAHDAGWRTLAPEIARFERTHAQALRAERRGWDAVVRRASVRTA